MKDKALSAEIFANTKGLKGSISNENFVFELPATKSVVALPLLGIEIADKNIVIQENKVNFNDKSVITYSGEVLDFEKLKSISFNAKGNIVTDDLVKLILRPYCSFRYAWAVA